MVSYGCKTLGEAADRLVLILIVMDNGLLPCGVIIHSPFNEIVLILIVMDNGLLHGGRYAGSVAVLSLNPYCNG